MLGFEKIAVHKAATTVYAAVMPEHATDTPRTVKEAAKVLGITANPVRKRVERGTLRSERDGEARYVILDADMPRPADGTPNGMPTDQALTMTRLENEVGFLRELVRRRDEELRREREAREEAERRHDMIVMRMAERIPELEAPPTPATRESPRTVAGSEEGSEPRSATGVAEEGSEPRSWWRQFFGV